MSANMQVMMQDSHSSFYQVIQLPGSALEMFSAPTIVCARLQSFYMIVQHCLSSLQLRVDVYGPH